MPLNFKQPNSVVEMSRMANPYAGQTFAQYSSDATRAAAQGDQLQASRAQRQEDIAYKKALSDAIGQDVTSLTTQQIKERILPILAKYKPEAAIKMKSDEVQPDTYDADKVRFKLVSALNSLNGRIGRMDASDPTLGSMQSIADGVRKEITSDAPSYQNAFMLLKKADSLSGGNDATVVEKEEVVVPSGLPTGMSVDPNTQSAIRNQKVSNVTTDWYHMEDVDGEPKPVPFDGINITNAPDNVSKQYEKAMDVWEKENDSALSGRATAAANKMGEKIAKRYWGKQASVGKAMTDISTQLRSLMDKFKSGSYDLANFADLKSTMADGRMTDSDVGLALGLNVGEGIWQNALSYLSGGKAGVSKLKDKDAARDAINRTIEAYNIALKNIQNPPFTGQYANQAKDAWVRNSYQTDFSNIPRSFTKIGGGSNKSTHKNGIKKDPLGLFD